MRILHLASFIGNIGDNASHMGFREILNQVIGNNYELKELEIRKFYQNYDLPDKQSFDENFAEMVNKFDLLFIGGGGFLDYWVDGSETGTTLDISEVVLKKIKIPIIIGSVGSFPHRPIPDGNINKFKRFLQYVKSRHNMHILLRNDGSKYHLMQVFGKELDVDFPEILDHAFFYDPPHQTVSITDNKYILINTALDQLGMQSSTNKLTVREYHKKMKTVLSYIFEQTEYDIVLAPHIYKDLSAIMELLNGVNDFNLRSRIKIAPYCQGNTGTNYIFNLYKHSEINIGMRFHANVCPLAFGNQIIGISALQRVAELHKTLNSFDYFEISDNLANSIINFKNTDKKTLDKNLKEEKKKTIKYYKEILTEENLI